MRPCPARALRPRLAPLKGVTTRLVLGLLVMATLVASPQPAAADIRQHVLGDGIPDLDAMLAELNATMRSVGFQVTPLRDETRTVPANDRSITYRHVEYQFWHTVDGRNISASLFLLVEPEREDFEPLRTYVMANFGYSLVGNAALRLRGVGFLAWAEWSSAGAMSTDTLNKELADWREAYLEVD